MSRRDRNQSYSGRDTLRYEEQEHRPRQVSDRERSARERPGQQPQQEWQSYGPRHRDERDYAARYLGYEARYEPHYESRQAPRYESQRFPATFGPRETHDDEHRVRRYEDEGDYRAANDRQHWDQQSQSGRYGAGQNLARPYAESYGRGDQSDYSRNAHTGQSEWGQRSARGYGHEEQRHYGHDHDRPWGQQLRDVGHEVVKKVKRAFRGPKGYKRSDERIREDVNDRLAQQDEFDPSEIEVSVASGEVTLTGSVHSRHEKFLAEEISDDVSGVTEVHNQLRVNRQQSTSLGATANAEGQTASAGWSGQTSGKNRNAHS